jgi:hypothetical protein
MADVCTVISSYVTLLACVVNPVCAPERGDGKVLCGPPSIVTDLSSVQPVIRYEPVQSCNRTVTNYRCTKPDGSTYDFTE